MSPFWCINPETSLRRSKARTFIKSSFNWFASALRPVSRIFRIFFHERHPTAIDHYPPTPEQLHSQKQAFIDSIDHDAVCRLASRYNNEELCHIFDSKGQSQ
ncbi:hypothetical protein V3481_019056 [Fusarium oxysporum f. sp. vasinfectum]